MRASQPSGARSLASRRSRQARQAESAALVSAGGVMEEATGKRGAGRHGGSYAGFAGHATSLALGYRWGP